MDLNDCSSAFLCVCFLFYSCVWHGLFLLGWLPIAFLAFLGRTSRDVPLLHGKDPPSQGHLLHIKCYAESTQVKWCVGLPRCSSLPLHSSVCLWHSLFEHCSSQVLSSYHVVRPTVVVSVQNVYRLFSCLSLNSTVITTIFIALILN